MQGKSMVIKVATKALVVWVAILALAVANGTFREAVLTPKLGTTPALILSGLLLSLLTLAATYLLLPWLGIRRPGQLLLIGLFWLALTVVFEFSFGLLRGEALTALLEAYRFKDGNIWLVVLAVTTAAPWLAAKLRNWV